MKYFKKLKSWRVPSLLLLVCLIITILGDFGRETLEYQNSFIGDNEFWRPLTGHFTHLGWRHFVLNGVGIIGIWLFCGKAFSQRTWAFMLLIFSLGTSLGFLFLNNSLESYTGLSGVAHGLLSAGVIYKILENARDHKKAFPWEYCIVFVGLWAKIVHEQLNGAVPFVETLSGGQVIIDAHLYGGFLGAVFGILKGKNLNFRNSN